MWKKGDISREKDLHELRGRKAELEIRKDIGYLWFHRVSKWIFLVTGIFVLAALIFLSYVKEYNKNRTCRYCNAGMCACVPQLNSTPIFGKCIVAANKTDTIKFNTKGEQDLLQFVNDILVTTSNSINYFTIIFAILGIGVTIGLVRYFMEYAKLKNQIENAANSVLDAALTTVFSIHLIDATQIFPCSYKSALDKISNTVREKYKIVKENSNYVALIIVDALKDFCEEKYHSAIDKLKEADGLSFTDAHGKYEDIIAFHLGRALKQQAYNWWSNCNRSGDDKKRVKEWLGEAEKYFRRAPNFLLTNSSLLSIALIRCEIESSSIQNDSQVISCLRDCFDPKRVFREKEKVITLNNYVSEVIKRFGTTEGTELLDTFDRQTAMTICLLLTEFESQKDVFVWYQATKCAEKLLEIFKANLMGVDALNIKAAWYFTMSRLAKKAGKEDDSRTYLTLALQYWKRTQKAGEVKSLFYADCLAEISFEEFEKKLKKFSLEHES